MKITDEQKQRVHVCAATTADLSVLLAVAGTLCMYAGADAIDSGVTLVVGSAAAGEMAQAYADLASDLAPGDMYDVEYTEPVEIMLAPPANEFQAALQSFTMCLLSLRAALRNVHLSYVRLQATDAALKDNSSDPEGAIYQDAKLFSSLQRQALWRNLTLCKRLQEDLLFSAPRVNMLWHQFKLRLPSQDRLSNQEVSEIVTTIRQDRAEDIATYQLTTFGITGLTATLHLLKQKGQLTDPALLLDEQWHKSVQLLTRAFQHVLDNFYA
jgi:hypothetical protein